MHPEIDVLLKSVLGNLSLVYTRRTVVYFMAKGVSSSYKHNSSVFGYHVYNVRQRNIRYMRDGTSPGMVEGLDALSE